MKTLEERYRDFKIAAALRDSQTYAKHSLYMANFLKPSPLMRKLKQLADKKLNG